MDDPVHEQYEAYPYPARDPRDEARRLVVGSPSDLAELNHHLFAGRRDFARPFRALVAGGGTGDATIMLAQQLADRGAAGEVVHLDLSRASRAIAEARAAARGLGAIRFVTGSLLDLPALDLGRFDYIDCCGVLHHLEDPAAGLTLLAEAVTPEGGLGIMVYGAHGRDGLYPLRESLASLAGDLPLDQRVGLTRRLLAALPATNAFRRNPVLADHRESDAGLVDLLLHARDRAYTLPAFIDLVDSAGLRTVSMIEDLRYDPATYLRDPKLRARLEPLSWVERAAIAEVLAGNMKKHMAYLCRGDGPPPEDRVARPDDRALRPKLRGPDGPDLAAAVRADLLLKIDIEGLRLRFPLPRLAPALLASIDGQRTLAEIEASLHERDPSLNQVRAATALDDVFEVLSGLNLVLFESR